MAIPSDVLVLQARVNWRDPFNVTYAFLTAILEASDGSEQRIARRRSPRRTYGYTVSCDLADLRVFAGQVYRGQAARYMIPDVPQGVRAAGPMEANAQRLALATAPTWAVRGCYAVLQDGAYSEARTIVSLSGTTVFFAETSSRAWSLNTRMYPGRIGVLQTSFEGKRLNAQTVEAPLLLSEDPGTSIYPSIFDSVFARGQTYNGREVFTIKPDWTTDPTTTFEAEVETDDLDQGIVEHYDLTGLRSLTYGFDYTMTSYADVKALVDFFYRQRGQQVSFYLPSRMKDMVAATPFKKGDRTLTMAGRDLFDGFGPTDRVFRNIAFLAGTAVVGAGVASIALGPDGASSILTLMRPCPVDAAGVTMICWLLPVRFASDSCIVAWQNTTLAKIKLTFKTLPESIDALTIGGPVFTINGAYVTLDPLTAAKPAPRITIGGNLLLISDQSVVR